MVWIKEAISLKLNTKRKKEVEKKGKWTDIKQIAKIAFRKKNFNYNIGNDVNIQKRKTIGINWHFVEYNFWSNGIYFNWTNIVGSGKLNIINLNTKKNCLHFTNFSFEENGSRKRILNVKKVRGEASWNDGKKSIIICMSRGFLFLTRKRRCVLYRQKCVMQSIDLNQLECCMSVCVRMCVFV